MKMPKIILSCAALLFSVCGSSAVDPKAEKGEDPVIGKWRWTDTQIVECKADHTFTVAPTNRGGKWALLPEKTVERKYTFTWDGGLFVDTLMMSRDSNELKGENQEKKKIRATKIR